MLNDNMKKLIPLTFLILLTSVLAQETTTTIEDDLTFIPEDEWLIKIKSIYKEYIDSGLFFPVALVIFIPIIIGGLSGLAIGRKGQLSIFLLELILGVLTFLTFPILVDFLLGGGLL